MFKDFYAVRNDLMGYGYAVYAINEDEGPKHRVVFITNKSVGDDDAQRALMASLNIPIKEETP